MPRPGIRVETRVRRTEGHCHPARCVRRLELTDNPQAHISCPGCCRQQATVSRGAPGSRPLPRILRLITRPMRTNSWHSHFTTTPLPRWKIFDDRPHFIQAVAFTQLPTPRSPTLAPALQSQSPLDSSTLRFSALDTLISILDTPAVPFIRSNHPTFKGTPTFPISPIDPASFRHMSGKPQRTSARVWRAGPRLRPSHSGPPQVQLIAATIRVAPPEPRPLLRRLLVVAT